LTIDLPDPATGVFALVLQHRSKRRPARIGYGLGHGRFRKASRVHIANENCTVFLDKVGAQLAQEVFPAICDLGMNRLGSVFVP